MSRLRYEAAWIVAGRAAAAVASFASVRILTSVMSPELYGRYALTVGIMSLVTGFVVSPVAQGVNRLFYEAVNDGVLRDFLRRALLITTALSIAGGLAGYPAFFWYLSGSRSWWQVATLIVVTLVASNIRDRAIAMFNLFRWRGRYVTLLALDSWIRVGSVSAGVLLIGPSLVSVAIGLAVGAVLSALLALPWLRQLVQQQQIRERFGSRFDTSALFSFSRPLFIVAALGWVVSTSDRYFLGRMVEPAELGRYVAGYQIANAGFAVVSGILFPIVMPIMLQSVAQSPQRSIDLDRYVLVVTLGAVAFGAAVVTDVAGVSRLLLSHREFDSGDSVIPVVCLGTVALGIQTIVEQQAHFSQNTRSLVVVYGIAALTNVAMNLVLIPYIGIAGAAVATGAAYVVLLVATVVVCKPRVAASTWTRTSLLIVGAIACVGLVRLLFPVSMPTAVRAPSRWASFALLYGGCAALLVRRELSALAVTLRARPSPG